MGHEHPPGDNIGTYTIGKLLNHLTPAQLWRIIGALAIVIGGSFSLGMFVDKLKTDFEYDKQKNQISDLQDKNTTLQTQLNSSLAQLKELQTPKRSDPGEPKLDQFNALASERLARETTLKDAVSKILSGQNSTRAMTIDGHLYQLGDKFSVPSWRWVTVLNLDPIKQQYSNGESRLTFGESCGIGPANGSWSDIADPTLEIIGFLLIGGEQNALVKYGVGGHPMGTPCPSGVIFAQKL